MPKPIETSLVAPAASLGVVGKTRRRGGHRSGIVGVLVAQACMGLVAVLVSWLIAGLAAGVSALVGALAYWLPNTLFALRLLLGLAIKKKANPFAFFVGEAFKLGFAVAVLVAAAVLGGDALVWPALLFGLLMVLKGYVLLLLAGRLP